MSEIYSTFQDAGINVQLGGRRIQFSTCPQCSAGRSAKNVKTRCLEVWLDSGNWYCGHCEWKGFLSKFKPHSHKVTKCDYVPNTAKLPKTSLEWLIEERKITQEVLERNKIGVQEFGGKSWICFPYYEGGEPVNVKKRTTDKADKFLTTKGGKQIFYGLDDVIGQETVIICEGELDKLALEVAGFRNAISVPLGAPGVNEKNPNLSYLDNCIDYFEDGTTFILAVDDDAQGKKLCDALAHRFGVENCKSVKYPIGCKDANDVLMIIGKMALKRVIDRAEPFPLKGLVPWETIESGLNQVYEVGNERGALTGYPQFDNHLSFAPGYLTIVTGIPSHGKTSWVDWAVCRLAVKCGWRTAFFSPENYPTHVHADKLSQILIGKPLAKGYNGRMDTNEFGAAKKFVEKHFHWIYPEDETFHIDDILSTAKGLIRQHGINQVVIDPFNYLQDDYEGDNERKHIRKVLKKIKIWERNNNVHVILVAHPTKQPREKHTQKFIVPTLYDISGSADFYNMADNGITIYLETDDDGKPLHNTVYIQKVKQDYLGKRGKVDFSFDICNKRFYEDGNKQLLGGYWIDVPTAQIAMKTPDYSTYREKETIYQQPTEKTAAEVPSAEPIIIDGYECPF